MNRSETNDIENMLSQIGTTYDYVDRQRLALTLSSPGMTTFRSLLDVLRAVPPEYVQAVIALALHKIGRPAVEPLISALHDEHASVRRCAAQALGMWGDARELAQLIQALKQYRAEAWENICAGLVTLGEGESVEAILTGLDASEIEENWLHAHALIEISPTALEMLGVGLVTACPDFYRLQVPVEIPTRAVEPLIDLLREDESRVQAAAAEALGKLGDSRAVGPLIESLRTYDPHIQRASIEALGCLRNPDAVWPLCWQLYGDELESAAHALGTIRDPRAAEFLAESLVGPVSEAETTAISNALVLIGAPSVDALIAELRKRKEPGRRRIPDVLVRLHDPRVVAELIEARDEDPDLDVRFAAARALDDYAADRTN